MSQESNNIMVILSSPSGAGKTTITKKIQQKYQSFKISVSHTTRKPRPNEIDGVDYYFVSEDKFKNLISNKKIYLIPPSKEELKKRLIKRNQDSAQEVERRYKAYDKDIEHWEDYDYVLINENLENCYKQIENIISINKDKSFKVSQKIQ